MKKLTFLLLIACLIAGTQARAQTITYQKKNVSLKELLKVIVKQTGYGHAFTGETLERVRRVDIDVINTPLIDVLNIFFKDQPLEYTIIAKVISISPKIPSPTEVMTLTARVMNDKDEFVPGVTITIRGNPKMVISNDDGEFLIPEISKTATILLTSVAYEPFEITLQGQTALTIMLKSKIKELGEVSVVASGYQNISKERSTGSYSKINNDLLNRRVSTNVLERIDDVTPGMIQNRNVTDGTNQSSRSIRGRSTIFSNAEPLIVVDNFPYPGNPNNINPNDIESITVLKDANAAAIWGAFSGNGVIVITTKKGKYSQAPRLSLNNNITIVKKPDAFYLPTLGVNEYISMEKYLFGQGFYNGKENDPTLPPLSPVVELLIKERDGSITTAEKEQLARFGNQDTRREVDKHIFRKGIYQQYSIGTSGGGANNNYFLSAGLDRNDHNRVGDKSQRVTLTANNTYSWFRNRLELNTGISFAETKTTLNSNNSLPVAYPYLQFVNEANDTLPVTALIRQAYIDTLNNDQLLDWNYYPIKEIRQDDNSGKLSDYRINLSLKYKIGRGFDANVLYQYNKGDLDQENYNSTATYFTRNMINRYSKFDGGEIRRPVPLGGIADRYAENYKAHNVRAQLNYGHSWVDKNERMQGIRALAGAEVRDISVESDFRRLYGYNKGDATGDVIDDSTFHPLFYAPSYPEQIPNETLHKKTVDRYVSFYMTTAYTIQERYTISISARKDESNLFGVKTNQKGVPLFSVGAAWSISREKFYDWDWLPYLKFRATHGYNGNVNKAVSAFTTASILYMNNYDEPMGTIINPPNPHLRWEKVQISNLGIDFAFVKGKIEGSIEYYIKKGTDLIGNTSVDPSNGVTQFRGNNAAMKGSGLDVVITTNNLQGAVKWNTVLILNHIKDKVTSYGVRQTSIAAYYNATQINPLVDRPLYSVYSLKWMGLDPLTGDPQGRLDGQVSKNYAALRSSTNFADLIYNGPANPTFFGSIRNTISWKQFALSFNITWRGGHYFRRTSVEYTDLIAGQSKGHADYNLRWQAPGDEIRTYIPSISYTGDFNRDFFYRYSEVLVEKGDHIRFQDLRLSYDLTKQQIKKLPMQLLSFYVYANNLGLLWKATEYDIDPDYVSVIPNARSWSMGIKVEF